MHKEIILANFATRPVRTSVSILAVAIEVTLILVIVGLVTGMNVETGKRIEGVGADLMFQPPNSSVFLGLNGAVMPMAIGEKLFEVGGVQAIAPVVTQFNSQGGFDLVYGINPDSFDAVSGGFNFLSGEMFDAPGEILIDDLYAAAKEYDVGDEMPLLNHQFRVTGIVEHGKGARLFLDIDEAQEMIGAVDKASLFFVKLEDPETTYDTIDRLEAMFPTYPARPLREMVSLMANSSLPALDAFLTVVMVIAVSIGVLVIFLSMYTTITERTREIGILRSLGASKGFVVRMILHETVWLCVIGIGIGIGLSFVIASLVQAVFPTLLIMIVPDWILRASLLALASGMFGALYPSFRAAGQDPVEALAYE